MLKIDHFQIVELCQLFKFYNQCLLFFMKKKSFTKICTLNLAARKSENGCFIYNNTHPLNFPRFINTFKTFKTRQKRPYDILDFSNVFRLVMVVYNIMYKCLL